MRSEVGPMEENPPGCVKPDRLSHRKALILWVLASGLGWAVVTMTLLFLL